MTRYLKLRLIEWSDWLTLVYVLVISDLEDFLLLPLIVNLGNPLLSTVFKGKEVFIIQIEWLHCSVW